MGQEIARDHFTPHDWEAYAKRLQAETRQAREWLDAGLFSQSPPVGGFEVEGWLVDSEYRPAARNTEFLQALHNPLATTELARFNIELNTPPLPLNGSALSRFEQSLQNLLAAAETAADQTGCRLLLIGILPSCRQEDFHLGVMTDSNRYNALNAQILKARHNRPLSLSIDGQESLDIQHDCVMLEAATTSFQVHMQTPAANAHHFYNASILASAPIMAVAGNSPLLFGHVLWQETRIPLFEQAVDTGREYPARVSFGSGFAHDSITECFEENLQAYPILLPMLRDTPPERFAHLRLHNGVIWRWNRPLIGFDADGAPHIRLEHRILPAGPSVPDMIANAALFYGLTQTLGTALCEGEPLPMAFAIARENFYTSARLGLDSQLRWDGHETAVSQLLLETLLPQAAEGLEQLQVNEADIRHYLGIIAARIEKHQTGAVWQQQRLYQTKGDITQMLRDYAYFQSTHKPVHTWTIN